MNKEQLAIYFAVGGGCFVLGAVTWFAIENWIRRHFG
jgi:hypothetical protein